MIQCLPILHPDPVPSTMTHNTPITMIAPPSLPIEEMLRILNHKGFLIVGYPEYLWEQYQVQKVFQELSSTNIQPAKGEFLVFQKVSLPIQDIAIFQEGIDDQQIQDWMAFDTMTIQQSTRSGPPVRKAHDGTLINHNPNSDNSKSNADVAVKYCLAMFRKK